MRNTMPYVFMILSLLFTFGCDDDDGNNNTAFCGDGLIGGTEVCDATDFGTETCVTQGFSGGTLTCAAACDAIDTSQCTTCGDGLIEGAEVCDGTVLGSETCVTQGFLGGTLACGASCEAFDTTGCIDDHNLPDTAVGDQMRWLVEAANAGEAPDATAFAEHFSANFQSQCNYACFLSEFYNPLANYYAQMIILGYEDTATETDIWARLSIADGDYYGRLAMVLEPTDNTINGILTTLAPDLDPAFGPIGSQELGLFIMDAYGNPMFNQAVELVNVTTGQPFETPVVAYTDEVYHYVRLEVPAGESEVGVKLVHSDGQVTYAFGSYFTPGKDRYTLLVWPNGTLESVAQQVGVTADPAKARIWTVLQYSKGQDFWSFEEFSSSHIGCATVTIDPTPLDTFYGGESFSPSEDATQTSTTSSAHFAFNADTVGHTITSTVDGNDESYTLPPLEADAYYNLWIVYYRETYPTNPTPVGCGE
ncbi:Cpe/LpqF family protein [Myxococcota bacterium]|nr:Cpe/LpqF family protein [Myxococcota bacterium]MBU1534853.1 Cpe/LpqF family protein [Myxococcota bacterium]